jgi:hypothetical protein
MENLQTLLTAIFFIVTGLSLCQAGLPRWANIVGGVCGIIVAILLLIGYF